MQNRLLPALRQPSQINKFARQSGWLVRKVKILSPIVFVEALISCVSSGCRSFREIAIEIGLLTGTTISKQALSERFNPRGVKFLKRIVTETLRKSVRSLPTHRLDHLPGVGRILIGDSSTVSLHCSLSSHFPGATNGKDKQSAQLKFQFTFDLLSGQWLQTDLGPACIPDQAAAPDILDTVIQSGDLIIRDLGYATLDTFDAIVKMGAFFLSRLPYNMGMMDHHGGRLQLQDIARAHACRPGDTFSMNVLLGLEKQFACRLVIIRVPKTVGDERRRRLKATAKRKGRKTPTKAYLAQQDWSFFITNLDETQADNAQLHELYRLRWRVENIFRISKSQTGLLKIAGHKTNRHHAEMLLWAWMLLMISMSKLGIFRLLEPGAKGVAPEVVTTSIFKGIERIHQWIAPSIELAAAGDFATLMERLRAQQEYHDRYEKRARISMPQRVAMALQLQSVLGLT
jgi:hypothetical protein